MPLETSSCDTTRGLAIILTARCNAACAHCSDTCGPHRTDALKEDDIVALMVGWARRHHPIRPQFMFSGGEPFLDFEMLLRIVKKGTDLGGIVTCVTNGYWARSVAYAEEMLTRLKDAGLSLLAISSSRWHEKFVSRQRVERVLIAGRNVGIPCRVKYAHPHESKAEVDQVRSWALAHGAEALQDLPLFPFMREGEPLPSLPGEPDPSLPEGRCPSSLMTVQQDYDVYSCCEPGANNPRLRIGSLAESSPDALYSRFLRHGLHTLLVEEGPAAIAQRAKDAGLGPHLKSGYRSVCELCLHLTSSPKFASFLNKLHVNYEADQQIHVITASARAVADPRETH